MEGRESNLQISASGGSMSAHGRRALGLLGVLALLVAVLSNANVVGTYVSAHGHITEVAEVDILRALAIEREHLLALGNL
jgi:hypothetical protein